MIKVKCPSFTRALRVGILSLFTLLSRHVTSLGIIVIHSSKGGGFTIGDPIRTSIRSCQDPNCVFAPKDNNKLDLPR